MTYFESILQNYFTQHPAQTGETYLQHLGFTLKMSKRFATLALVIFIHGLLPFLFTYTSSKQIRVINRILQRRAMRATQAQMGANI